MIYSQINPHPDLADYIDAFWLVEGVDKQLTKESIIPDGCVDLIFNLGEDFMINKGLFTVQSERIYLVGTMTVSQESLLNSRNKLIGVRFKPGGFSSFYNYAPLDEITDQTVEFDLSLLPDINKLRQHPFSCLNEYFSNRLTGQRHHLSSVLKDIQKANGQIGIEELAKRNFITARQLERNFKKYIGISPKEFSNIVRFQFAFKKIKYNEQQTSLSDIAFECGYYDHAHLSNEIRRYTGLAPSQF